ncbi:MAG: pantoate--beta-alanine ligase [bacterium]
MRVLETPDEMSAWSNAIRLEKRSIGFVPTMGFFHEGHLSLMLESKKENNKSVVSLFVNPTQFAAGEDLDNYPRDFDRDAKMAESAGVDVLFYPAPKAIYPAGYRTYVEVEDLSQVLCGKSRPTHFRGVATVVSKLFNIVKPHTAYFGQKDYQQCVIIRKMAADLNLDLKIKVLPTVREPDGLAMSSRNTYLSPGERQQAAVLYHGMAEAQAAYQAGERKAAPLRMKVENAVKSVPASKMDYIEVVHPDTLQPLETIGPAGGVIAVAVYIGKTRLIDNVILRERA